MILNNNYLVPEDFKVEFDSPFYNENIENLRNYILNCIDMAREKRLNNGLYVFKGVCLNNENIVYFRIFPSEDEYKIHYYTYDRNKNNIEISNELIINMKYSEFLYLCAYFDCEFLKYNFN